MALATSGEISIGGLVTGRSINLEFGRSATAQTSMSQLYRGGGIVPDATANNAIATAGAISLSQFYGATNRLQVNITISPNQTNYVLNTAKAAGYVAGITDVTVTINSGVYVSSSSTGVYALDVDTSWATGDTVTIVNNGFIIGMGGNGGSGRSISGTTGSGGSNGAPGGPALRAQRPIILLNYGTIGGGGGGGAGGASGNGTTVTTGPKWDVSYVPDTNGGSGGGGGRSGTTNSVGGGGGSASGMTYNYPGYAGASGTVTAAGAGGVRTGGAGGSGGGWGASGGGSPNNGSISTVRAAATSPGAGGAAINGNTNITWVATGTRLGAIS